MDQIEPTIGLVLSGGGARGAYQAGVLSAVAEIAANMGSEGAFKVITGASAGAVNATHLAASPAPLADASARLCELWGSITAQDVFKTDALTAGRLGFKFAIDAAVGALYRKKLARSLLDTSPLRAFLAGHIDFSQIARNLQAGKLDALALTAIHYANSHSITFVQSREKIALWERSRRRAVLSEIGVEHVMASGAIPIFFPPVRVGESFYGDGCLRNTAPMSPAIHLGADRIIVASVRRPDAAALPNAEGSGASGNGASEASLVTGAKASQADSSDVDVGPSIARILGVVLNALLMDAVEFDMERLGRINQTIDAMPEEVREQMKLRKVDFLWIRPSKDIGAIAGGLYDRLPGVIRYLVSGLGSAKEASDLTSYLLFDPEFCGELIRLGREDAFANRKSIEAFICAR